MRRFVIVGLGSFGSAVAETLYRQGHEVVAVDTDEELVDSLAPHVTRAVVGDGTRLDVLEAVGAKGADAGIVSTGDDITASVLATMAMRDVGVAHVYAKEISRAHGRVMARMGVTEAVFPERESGQNLASRLAGGQLLKYIQLVEGYSLQEAPVPAEWQGKALRELNIRSSHRVTVVALHDVLSGKLTVPPDPATPLTDSDTLLLAGPDEELERIFGME